MLLLPAIFERRRAGIAKLASSLKVESGATT
jgi:hypothetical protein